MVAVWGEYLALGVGWCKVGPGMRPKMAAHPSNRKPLVTVYYAVTAPLGGAE